MNQAQPGSVTPGSLRVIRAGLVLGPVIFAAIVLFVLPAPAEPRFDESVTRIVIYAFFAAAFGALALLALVRALRARAATFDRVASLSIVGWAIGEGIALFGCVLALLTSYNLPLYLGLAVVVASVLLFPIPHPGHQTAGTD